MKLWFHRNTLFVPEEVPTINSRLNLHQPLEISVEIFLPVTFTFHVAPDNSVVRINPQVNIPIVKIRLSRILGNKNHTKTIGR